MPEENSRKNWQYNGKMSEQEQTKNITINMHELSNEKEFQRFKFLDHFLPVIQKQKIQISPLASKRKKSPKSPFKSQILPHYCL